MSKWKLIQTSLFFDDLEKAVNELKQAYAVITEQDMLISLPQDYSYIGGLIDVLPEHKGTLDYLNCKVKESRRKI